MANTYLTRSLSSTNTSWTFSAWVKRSGISATSYLISWGSNGTDGTGIGFSSSDDLFYYTEGTGSQIKTSAKYRDTNGFYHVVVKSNSNAITLYINGEEPTQAWTSGSNGVALDTSTMQIGKWVTSAYYHNGSMSHIHFTDGTAYDATAFGETDANGVWKIKTSPSVTYGTNGFFILKDGNSVTDSSPNSNNFTVGGGTLTKTEDNPSNVFTTLNSLYRDGGSVITYSNGNNTCDVGGANDWCTSPSTLGATSGKFYFEGKFTINSGTEGYIGIAQDGNLNVKTNVPNYLGIDNYSIGYYSGNGKYYRATSSFTYGNTFTTGDIVGCAVDIDNKKIYFSKNGVWQNSGDPTSGATGTGAIDVSSYFITGDPYFLCFSPNQSKFEGNFGNGYFGTTAVASAGTNASGIGIFEYDVPTGYTALSTKGLNL